MEYPSDDIEQYKDYYRLVWGNNKAYEGFEQHGHYIS